MENKKPLSGVRLIVFSILFIGVMLLVGYKLLYKENGSNDLQKLNTEVSSQEGKALFDKGFDFYTKGNYSDAAIAFKASTDKGYDVSYALLGECELHMKNIKPAETYLLKALAVKDGESYLTGYFSGVEYNLGLLYYIEKNKPMALDHFTKAKNLGHKDADKYLTELTAK